ncbi:unnamed protein product, partial [Rotaria magnacalcarata]
MVDSTNNNDESSDEQILM